MKINLNSQVSQGKINPDSAHTNLFHENSYLLSSENLGLYLNFLFKKLCLPARSIDRTNTEFQLERHQVESRKFHGWNLLTFKVKSIKQKRTELNDLKGLKHWLQSQLLGKLPFIHPKKPFSKLITRATFCKSSDLAKSSATKEKRTKGNTNSIKEGTKTKRC